MFRKSSQFQSMFYLRNVLTVTFKRTGDVWSYSNVPVKVIEELIAAESKGKYFHANIKKEYDAKKIN